MSSSHKLATALLFATFASLPALAQSHSAGYYGYGRAPSEAEIAGWAISVRPDGQGLPLGKGNVSDGAEVYMQQCAACHGTFGEGADRYPKLVGGSLKGERPEPTVGSYWPFATTLFDYVNSAMPFPSPHQLSADQVYAITAYILNLNNLVDSDFVATPDTLPKVKMPNHDRFIWKDPRPDTKNTDCMVKCVDPATIKIESTAEGKNLTPRTTGPLDQMKPK
jgi:S-disulfanyl-L-cysteine oxidoreductase SoxD